MCVPLFVYLCKSTAEICFETATHCNTLQHTATYCDICVYLCKRTAGICLETAAALLPHCCHAATHYDTLHHICVPMQTYSRHLPRSRLLPCACECGGVCCSVLQCFAVCCSVLQYQCKSTAGIDLQAAAALQHNTTH